MKIAVFWKKYNGSHHKEIRRIYSFIFHGLSELGYDFDIFEQQEYHKRKIINRASRQKYLPESSWSRQAEIRKKPLILLKRNDLPNMPFEGYHVRKEYDKSIMFHTIGVCSDTTHVKPGYLPGYFYFDAKGYSGWSGFCDNKTLLAEEDDTEKISDEEFNKLLNISKYKQSVVSDFSTSRPYLFVPLQIPSDSVSNLSDFSSPDFIDEVVNLSAELPYDIVFKRHPRCTDESVAKRLQQLSEEKNIHITKSSVLELINSSAGVLVVNSGVGFEALMRGKPVITFGDSDYSQATLRYINDIENIKRIKEYLHNFDLEKKLQIQMFTKRMLKQCFVRIGDMQVLEKALRLRLTDGDTL